jgi:uncharacterized protein (TIGR00725 family)
MTNNVPVDLPIPLISVVGDGRSLPETDALAEAVGAELARRGYGVVCGGLGGVMAAACRGARSLGGHTVGLLPGYAPHDANPWVEIAIPTGLGEARNVLVVNAGLAVIAIGGAYGTLSEIALALRAGKTVVALRTWQIQRPDGAPVPLLQATSAVEAVALATGGGPANG